MNQLSPLDRDGLWGAPQLSTTDFQAIAAILHKAARISLAPQKATLVRSRLARRLREHGLSSFGDYLALIRRDAAERGIMIDALTTNHTHFFREKHHFDHLVSEMIPYWKARASPDPIRIWSSASSTGEEVYSAAMSILGRDQREALWAKSTKIQLLATDISSQVVAAVHRAEYSKASWEQIPQPYRRLWTRSHGDGFVMAPEARDMVTSTQLNLFDRWPMRYRFDAIFCRNVMIYFNEEAKAELEARLIDQLAPGGVLYIGHSERLVGAARASMSSCGHTMYRKAEHSE